MEPTEVRDGLAVYARGEGPAILVVPYPHASGGGPMVEGPLVKAVLKAGFRVVTFDPPGHDRSTRVARIGLDEMVACSAETLDVVGIEKPVPVLGHSMGALCAFFLGLRRPGRVARLALVGTPPGGGLSIVRYRGMPFNLPPWDGNFWRALTWGILLAAGWGNMAMHKRMDDVRDRASFVHQDLVPNLELDPLDHQRPAPPRDRWWYEIRRVRTVPLARGLRLPTLLMVGRHDPQTPVRVSEALHDRVPDSRLVVFERSGHSPFVEEPDRFVEELVSGDDGQRR